VLGERKRVCRPQGRRKLGRGSSGKVGEEKEKRGEGREEKERQERGRGCADPKQKSGCTI